MKMVIVLDKICLLGVVVVSTYVGYKAGVAATEVKFAMNNAKKTNFGAED